MSATGTDEPPIRVGIIGTGSLGTYLATQFRDHPDATVVSIADVSEESRQRAGGTVGVPPEARYEQWERMLDEESLDGVVIVTPHTLHYEQIVAALDDGLHVLCEKPLVTDLDRARELAERADSSEQVLMVGYQRHLDPAFVAAREWWSDHDGPDALSAEISQDWIAGQRENDGWRIDPELSGGGFLYDTGSHVVDAVLWTTGGTPVSVDATMQFVDDERRVDATAALRIEMDTGTIANLTLAGDTSTVREHHHMWNGESAVYVNGTGWTDRSAEIVTGDGTTFDPAADTTDRPNKADAFVDSIREDTEPPATADDALSATAVIEAAYQSARTGERVPIALD